MGRMLRRLNRGVDRNKGILMLFAVAIAAVALVWPSQVNEAAAEAKQSDWAQDLFALFTPGGENATSGGGLREAHVKYEQGRLSSLGVVKADGAGGSDFTVDGTATTGDPAKFELYCGDRTCGTITDHVQEPLTYWIVGIPDKPGLTKLVVTAGASTLEVAL